MKKKVPDQRPTDELGPCEEPAQHGGGSPPKPTPPNGDDDPEDDKPGGEDGPGDGDEDDPGDGDEDPPTYIKEPCPCSIQVVPFDCTKGTCQFGGEQGTEPGGIRLDAMGPDPVHLLIEIELDNPNGTVEVIRLAPQAWQQGPDARVLVFERCVVEERCLLPFFIGAGGAPRPPKVVADRAASVATPLVFRLKPYTDHEVYKIVIKGDTCTADEVLEAVDLDSVVDCYRQCLAIARLMRPAPGLFTPAETIAEFFARLAINGAQALGKEYHNSAVGGPRSFRDFVWAALLSAWLAEDMLRAFVAWGTGVPAGRQWDKMFELANEGANIYNFRDLKVASKRFGRAHTRNGVAGAFGVLPANPCCARDLKSVFDTLLAAQTPLLRAQFGVNVPGLGTPIAGTPLDPAQRFAKALSHALRRGATRGGSPGCAGLLPP